MSESDFTITEDIPHEIFSELSPLGYMMKAIETFGMPRHGRKNSFVCGHEQKTSKGHHVFMVSTEHLLNNLDDRLDIQYHDLKYYKDSSKYPVILEISLDYKNGTWKLWAKRGYTFNKTAATFRGLFPMKFRKILLQIDYTK